MDSPSLASFVGQLRSWDEKRTQDGFDPTSTLNEMASLLEKVKPSFFKHFMR